ncbi:MAG: hypothetical protein R3343_11320 [Nitriliruptorales bacterium]|nr:hypothetical protein [Nitriliruptorales bacterium]
MKKRTALLIAVALATAGMSSLASADTLTVSAATVNGSRTLAVLGDVGGTDISTLTLGAGDTAPFATTVTDVAYEKVGFDVTARLSRLYQSDGSGGFNCGSFIEPKALSITFADVPYLEQVDALVAPVFDLDGTVDLTDGTTGLVVDGVVHQAESLYTYTLDLATDATPIQVTDLKDGTADPFSNRAAFTDCSDTGASTPTDVLLNQGTPNDTLGTLYDTVEDNIRSTGDTASDGTPNTVGEYVTEGTLDLAAVKQTVADALGVDVSLLTDSSVQSLSATLQQISQLVGQNGVYISTPVLNLDRTEASADSAPTGVYKGEMTVTIADTP